MAPPTTATTTIIELETCQICPSVPPTKTIIPLTFLDLPWLLCIPMQRLFFFDHHFSLSGDLPRLKQSLSLALRHFSPLAAVLVSPPPPLKPHLLLSPTASVSLTLAQSSSTHLNLLLSRDPRDVTDCHPLLPKLPSDGGATPVLALQLTVFPNSAVAIGATFSHVAADGRSFNHFLKSWAFFSRTLQVDQPLLQLDLESPPSHNRAVVLDPYGLEPVFLNQWWAAKSSMENGTGRDPAPFVNKLRATFIMGRADILKLKQSLLAHCNDPLTLHASTFVVTVAFTWVQLVKSQQRQQETRDGDETYHLSFVADCRNRRGLEYSIPATYFGNCLAICYVSVKKDELLSENGVLRAAQAIGERVKELDGGVLRGAHSWMSDWEKLSESGKLVTVAGSPSLRVYDTDFGWGRPRKFQNVQIDVSGAIALAECRDEEGGMEIGLALNSDQMNTFSALFERCLKHL